MNFRKKLTRSQFEKFLAELPTCIIAMEACSSAHYWGRLAESVGHEVRLIPAIYVKPFAKRHKSDVTQRLSPKLPFGRPCGSWR